MDQVRAAGGRKTRGMPHEISELIRHWMTVRGVSWSALQAQLHARGTSVSESTMSRLLNGHSEPKIGTLGAIADVLQIELRDLMPTARPGLRLPMVHWTGEGFEHLDVVGELGLGLDLVAIEMDGEVLLVDLAPPSVDDGAEVLIVDLQTQALRRMRLHVFEQELVRYSDAAGYLLGPIAMVRGVVRAVISAAQPDLALLEPTALAVS